MMRRTVYAFSWLAALAGGGLLTGTPAQAGT